MVFSKAVLIVLLLAFKLAGQIVLSEIMFNPAGNERYDEYIEIYNTSATEAIDVSGWLVSDGTKFNTIVPFGETAVLQPGQYAIILVPNYFSESQLYDSEIPATAVLLTINSAQFGSYGLKNSDGEPVSIHLPDTTLAASYTYAPENGDGFSEEKIDLTAGDAPDNWTNSRKKGGTPGYENSVKPQAVDVGITSLEVWPQQPSTKDSLRLVLALRNFGQQAPDSITVVIADSSTTGFRIVQKSRVDQFLLAPGDSARFEFQLEPLEIGEHTLVTTIKTPNDGNTLNDTARVVFEVNQTFPPGCVVINELMYDTDEKAEEWLELYNTSALAIDLKNWRLKDKRKTMTVTTASRLLAPGGYCVVTNNAMANCDSTRQIIAASLPELNNTGDTIVLLDAAGAVIDSVYYERDYGGGRFISLERVRAEESSTDARNWRSCTAATGATPGEVNSASPQEHDAALEGLLQTKPLKPEAGDDVALVFAVANAGRQPARHIALAVYASPLSDSSWIEIGQASIDLIAEKDTASSEVVWRGIPPGVFIVQADITMPMDMVMENNFFADTVWVSYPPGALVINEIMYSPASDMCEWVELLNPGENPVEICGWSVSDSDTSAAIKLTEFSFLVNPGDFLVVAQDSSALELGAPELVICKNLPSLANDFDAVVLCDGLGRIVDQINYSADLGGAHGRSLERIDPKTPAEERSNWTTCVAPDGHTAGSANSVHTPHKPLSTTLAVSPDPFSPDGDGHDDFAGISYALPATVAHVNVKIYDMRGRLVRFLLNNSPSGATRTVFWDGLDEDGSKCRMGIYIVFLEALNESKMCIEQAKKTVVLAGVL